jgi:hypothetical protein
MKMCNMCPIHQCQETFLCDTEMWTNKPQFPYQDMETGKDIWTEVYMHADFYVIYGFMGFMISGYRGIE